MVPGSRTEAQNGTPGCSLDNGDPVSLRGRSDGVFTGDEEPGATELDQAFLGAFYPLASASINRSARS